MYQGAFMSGNHLRPENEDSGISVKLRLSETLIAVGLSASISFGAGFAVSNVSSHIQNVSTCSSQVK
jgi:hypothetical protein